MSNSDSHNSIEPCVPIELPQNMAVVKINETFDLYSSDFEQDKAKSIIAAAYRPTLEMARDALRNTTILIRERGIPENAEVNTAITRLEQILAAIP